MQVFKAYAPKARLLEYGPVGYFETKNRCPCLDGDKCGIYVDRPLMCRIFPFMLYQDANDPSTIAFDFSLCPRHDPGISTANLDPTEEAVLGAFHVTREEFWDFLALYFLKEVRVEDALKRMVLRDHNRLNTKQTSVRCIEARTAILKRRPQLPQVWASYFKAMAQKAYNAYKQALGDHPIKTAEMVKITGALMSVFIRAEQRGEIHL